MKREKRADHFAVISGAARGIGQAVLKLFLERGYSCLAIDKDQKALLRLEEEVGERHRSRLTCVERDLLAAEQAPREIAAVSAHCAGTFTLVNMIGGAFSKDPRESDEGWPVYEKAYRFNLRATVLLTNACVPLMKKKEAGYIVNISSVIGRSTLGHIGAAYTAAKAAVIAYSRKTAAQYAKDHILVNTVCPGIIATDRIRDLWRNRSEDINKAVLQSIPIGRLGEPEEVARAIVFLGSPENTYITGAVLDVNGGMFMP